MNRTTTMTIGQLVERLQAKGKTAQQIAQFLRLYAKTPQAAKQAA